MASISAASSTVASFFERKFAFLAFRQRLADRLPLELEKPPVDLTRADAAGFELLAQYLQYPDRIQDLHSPPRLPKTYHRRIRAPARLPRILQQRVRARKGHRKKVRIGDPGWPRRSTRGGDEENQVDDGVEAAEEDGLRAPRAVLQVERVGGEQQGGGEQALPQRFDRGQAAEALLEQQAGGREDEGADHDQRGTGQAFAEA